MPRRFLSLIPNTVWLMLAWLGTNEINIKSMKRKRRHTPWFIKENPKKTKHYATKHKQTSNDPPLWAYSALKDEDLEDLDHFIVLIQGNNDSSPYYWAIYIFGPNGNASFFFFFSLKMLISLYLLIIHRIIILGAFRT